MENNIERKKKTVDIYDARDKTEFLKNLSLKDKERLMTLNAWALKSMEYSIKDREMDNIQPKWGEIWNIDLGFNIGAEMDKVRPCIIVSYNDFNDNGKLVTAIPITSNMESKYDTQFIIDSTTVLEGTTVYGLAKAEDITNKSKARMGEKLGELNFLGKIFLIKALLKHLNLTPILNLINKCDNIGYFLNKNMDYISKNKELLTSKKIHIPKKYGKNSVLMANKNKYC